MDKILPMLKIEKMMVNPCQECTHIVWDETGEAVVIDCGVFYPSERRHLLALLHQNNLKLVHVLLTHAHHDHLYGNDLLWDNFGLLPELHEADSGLMKTHVVQRIKEVYGDKYPYSIPVPDHYLRGGDVIAFGNHKLQVMHTPGHTPGSVVYYCPEEEVAFTGDTLFAMSVGRTDLEGGNEDELQESLKHLSSILHDDTTIYPGHGKKSTIGHEKACNPYLL